MANTKTAGDGRQERLAPARHVVILGHPDADGFCGSVARAYCEAVAESGQEAELRDLYRTGFDPLLKDEERPGDEPFEPAADITADLALLQGADVITLVYPIWFGMPPAIIKGYVDRVLGSGFTASELKRGVTHPHLAGKRLLIFTSSASTLPWLEERGQWVALRHAFETYLQGIFSLRGAGHFHFDAIVPGLAPRVVAEHLAEVRERTRAVCAQVLSEQRATQSAAILALDKS